MSWRPRAGVPARCDAARSRPAVPVDLDAADVPRLRPAFPGRSPVPGAARLPARLRVLVWPHRRRPDVARRPQPGRWPLRTAGDPGRWRGGRVVKKRETPVRRLAHLAAGVHDDAAKTTSGVRLPENSLSTSPFEIQFIWPKNGLAPVWVGNAEKGHQPRIAGKRTHNVPPPRDGVNAMATSRMESIARRPLLPKPQGREPHERPGTHAAEAYVWNRHRPADGRSGARDGRATRQELRHTPPSRASNAARVSSAYGHTAYPSSLTPSLMIEPRFAFLIIRGGVHQPPTFRREDRNPHVNALE